MHGMTIIFPLKLNLFTRDMFYILNSSEKFTYTMFLDSSLLPNKYSLFSYLAFEPDFTVKGERGSNEFLVFNESKIDFRQILKETSSRETGSDSKTRKMTSSSDPFVYLRKILNLFIDEKKNKIYIENPEDTREIRDAVLNRAQKDRDRYIPDFTGGFTGYFSYDLKNHIEKLPQNTKHDLDVPLFYLMYFSSLLAYDHTRNIWLYIYNCPGFSNQKKDSEFAENLKAAISRKIEILNGEIKSFKDKTGLSYIVNPLNTENDLIEKQIIRKYRSREITGINLRSNFSKGNYIKSVIKAKQYIHNGDIYQVNVTQRFHCRINVEPYDLYYILRKKNPAPYSAYLSFPELKVGSSSPERFLYLKNSHIQTRPIKGTRPRGMDEAEDKKYIGELKESLKDRAELNMIVDLERNDLGKFCRYFSVKVSEHAVIEAYARVFHLVSTVKGIVKKGYDIIDIIKSTFPGGSITGAPKIRAMEIIDELEPTARNIYTGSIGYIGNDGIMDLNIVIRTFIIKDGTFYYNVGGGIVEDSDPCAEYQETMDKGLALKETLDFFKYENLAHKSDGSFF